MAIAPRADADRLLDDLNEAQREAVRATTGPVAILAGAGTGKTRVISRRTAHAIATGVVAADQVLVVTFTEKAAREMVERLRALGLGEVIARTFHAHALSQLRFFWPSRHDGAALPDLLDSKIPYLVRAAQGLAPPYKFTPIRDLATEIEWAKSRGIGPDAYESAIGTREPPIRADLMGRVFADYERAKARAGRIDFDDLLAGTIELLETDPDAAALIRARKSWFSVDEYQDTNPHQERLLELWAGRSDDVCVVGDEDQTIYTFTGASSTYLTGFADRHPGARVIALTENYRSTPQVLGLANRLLAGDGRNKTLRATRPDGPAPTVEGYQDGDVELSATVRRIKGLLAGIGSDPVDPAQIAILVRMNAQLAPIEEALTRAGIAYQVRGVRFYDRPDVVAGVGAIRRLKSEATGRTLATAIRTLFRTEFGHEGDGPAVATGPAAATGPRGDEARERAAALETILATIDEVVRADPASDVGTIRSELERRAAHERNGAADGVNLLTYHRAKGLEWEAVFLPMLEDGTLPIRQAFDDEAALAEERRLLYVGITRARRHLHLSWADRREARGRETRRTRSRFLAGLAGPAQRTVIRHADGGLGSAAPGARPRRAVVGEDPLFDALREWRTRRAHDAGMPAYVVASDATLSAIAAARPSSLAGLERVNGIGPGKLDKYGAEILAIVASVAPVQPAD
ncbi:MAG TPA: ATP-dependent DNA helicase UvrD2 [Patescibacteria group bacterium]|nr:ATP-dependent DNA helicase UvrD2 [Patescibacteria group bacterium]